MKNRLLKYLANIPGWRTKKKIVVWESDDWGSIRMPSKTAYKHLEKAGIPLGKGQGSRYNNYDTLASKDDLEALFDTMRLFKDSRGRSPVFTAVSLVANPDFEAIEENGFEKYHYEPFTNTLKRYGREEAWNFWQIGFEEKLFYPEFHGREHLNILAWMRALKEGDEYTHIGFQERFWGFNRPGLNYQSAFDLEYLSDLQLQKEVINSGLQIFKELHGRKARYFVPPNGPFNNSLQQTAKRRGIQYLSTAKIQREPLGQKRTRRRWHYLGKQSKFGITFITRNCFFEPSATGQDWVDSCLSDINIAFQMHKPAVISSHRVNYIGGLESSNRTNGLNQLKLLLQNIHKNWPDVIYLTSSELGDLIDRKTSIDELA